MLLSKYDREFSVAVDRGAQGTQVAADGGPVSVLGDEQLDGRARRFGHCQGNGEHPRLSSFPYQPGRYAASGVDCWESNHALIHNLRGSLRARQWKYE